MEDIIRFECLENKLVEVNGQLVLLDRDVKSVLKSELLHFFSFGTEIVMRRMSIYEG